MIKIEIIFDETLNEIILENLLKSFGKVMLIQGFAAGHKVRRPPITIPIDLIRTYGEERMAAEAAKLFTEGLFLSKRFPFEDIEKILKD